ncbi:MAG: RNase P modulator RnpM [Dehalococcoidia bacterium]
MGYIKGHVPERTCIACRQKRPKRELVRVVCNPEGKVEVDPNGKKTGRGAYLCRNKPCWEFALKRDKKDRLAHALKTRITQENWVRLSDYINSLPIESQEGVNESKSIK